MMQHWSEDHIRFMLDAAEFGTFYPQLVQRILPLLPQGGSICDAGCGLGHLAVALSPYFSSVTACDRAKAPLQNLKHRAPQNLTILHGDISTVPPALPYDGMVFCFFGQPEEILSVAERQCGGEVVVIQRASRHHRFAAKNTPPHRQYDRELSDLLQERNIPYGIQHLSLEFGQPFRSQTEALRFFHLYGQGNPLSEGEILSRLVPIADHPEFCLYLPQSRDMTITTFRLPRKRHLFLTGEKQVGKSTLLRRLTERITAPGGFLTVRKPQANGNFAVHMLHPRMDTCCDDNLLFICGGSIDPRRFDELGCQYLSESRFAPALIMDELGRKEENAITFQETVLRALDGDIPVYGVLQKADSAFLRRIAAYPAVFVVEVTKENRDRLYDELKKKW